MKNQLTILKVLPVILLVAFSSILGACKKDDNNEQEALLSVTHVSPDGPELDFYLDDNKAGSDISYSDHVNYFNVFSGSRTASVEGTSDTSANLSEDINLESGAVYSLYITGEWEEAEFLLLRDTLTAPAAGKAKVRFINLSPGAPALDLNLNDSTKVGDKMFKSASSYTAVDGDVTYSLELREKDASEVKASLADVALEKGKIYTIISRGSYTGTGEQALKIQIVKNN